MNTSEIAAEMSASILHAIRAHAEYPRRPKDAIRFWDKSTPYAVHPIWCAMTLLTETTLSEDIRSNGYQALLWHDILEDTKLPLPQDTRKEVETLVREMTFEDFDEEREKIWERSDTAKLLKLYDKVSNLLDGSWMSNEKWNTMVEHARKLAVFVSGKYGDLNILKIAASICKPRDAISSGLDADRTGVTL